MEIIIGRGFTLKDWILNIFYRSRYKFYAKHCKKKLKNYSPKEKTGRTLVFEDDFDEVSWSRKQKDDWRKWGIGEHWGSFHPRNGRSHWVEPVLNDDSTATFGTKYEPKTFYRKEGSDYWYRSKPQNCVEEKVVPYSVGGLSTAHTKPDGTNLFKQQYGRWELRAKVPAIAGIRSAYWMWGSTWPPEIDVFEIDGRSDHKAQKINLHFGKNEDTDGDGVKEHPSLGSTLGARRRDGEWQEWVLEWKPGKMEMYTDGIKIFQITSKKVLKWYDDPIAQMWVLVYQSVIGDVENEPDEDGWYSKMIVDYVRVYE
jgi:beta-glucanase (GH16 family)